MPITKAVITSAGFGTRFLPISKTLQKEMLPILNRPIVDYVVDDCIRAGINQIIFVVNEHNYQTLHYYRENQRLFNYLQEKGKADLYQYVKNIHQKAEFYFVKQTDQDQYGTAIPVHLAREHIQNEEAFLYLTGDDFVYSSDKNFSLVGDLIQLYTQYRPAGVVTCYPRPQSEVHRYGIAGFQQHEDYKQLTQLIEKPTPEAAPSNLANISKYILTPQILEVIEQQQPNPDTDELYITDSLQQLAQKQLVLVHETESEYLDGGNVANWLKANLTIAADDPKLRQTVLDFCRTRL